MNARGWTCLVALLVAGCAQGGATSTDAGGPTDAMTRDADDRTRDGGLVDADTPTDADAPVDDGGADGGGADGGGADGGARDAGRSDAGPPDAGPPPVTCTEPGLTTEVHMDTASSGTPDTYTVGVRPGDPFCAEITGGGSGTWAVNVSNGTSAGIYCSHVTRCRIHVPVGQTTLFVTAVTTDIGAYTLTVRRIVP